MAKKKTEETAEKTTAKNTVTITDSGACKKKVSIEVPEETVKNALEGQYKELKADAQIPGFRKGRAPIRLLEKRFGNEVVDQVKLKLLAQASEEALKENKLNTLGDPNIDYEKIELPESGPLKFEFEVEVRPEFELPNLEGIEIHKPKLEVTDAQIDAEIETLRRRNGIWVPQENGTVEKGDQVIADVETKLEGDEAPQRKDNTEIFVRPHGFAGDMPIEKLDEVLHGAKQGDRKSTTVEIAKTYYDEKLRGKKADISITVKDIKRMIPAEMNEEFIKKFGVENEQQLRDRLRELLSDRAETQARDEMKEQVFKHLLDNTQFDLPVDVVADQSQRVLHREFYNMMMRGVQREQIEEHLDELKSGSEERAREQLKTFFIMDKIADKLDISVSEEEINGYIARMAAQRNRRPEKMREEMVRDGSLAQFTMQVREDKVVSKLLETAKISEVEPEKLAEKKKAAPKKSTKKEAAEKEPKSEGKTEKAEGEEAPAKKPRKKKTEE
jgi:trigger factor